jgi:hypothetical protein
MSKQSTKLVLKKDILKRLVAASSAQQKQQPAPRRSFDCEVY